ncbi:MAG: MarR family transcriptional regulator [Oscillospiraceae bacterium]|nr:MarR family transcriptional regulator [Oscillospiraceae bacterium]
MSVFSSHFNALDRYLRRCRREYMAPLGLKGIHARMFLTICRTPGYSQDQLAKRLWLDKSTVARQMELLEKKGYVTRNPSETDKRVLCVYPTEQMLEFSKGLQSATEEWERTLLQDLTAEEIELLNGLLQRVHARVNKEA